MIRSQSTSAGQFVCGGGGGWTGRRDMPPKRPRRVFAMAAFIIAAFICVSSAHFSGGKVHACPPHKSSEIAGGGEP